MWLWINIADFPAFYELLVVTGLILLCDFEPNAFTTEATAKVKTQPDCVEALQFESKQALRKSSNPVGEAQFRKLDRNEVPVGTLYVELLEGLVTGEIRILPAS